MHQEHPRFSSEGAEQGWSWFLVGGAGGAQVVGEPAGAFSRGQEVLDLLVGEVDGQVVTKG